ncbi:hypothetical protein [Sphingobacterium sp. UDSM-2020]|uniref:hypothetical protein n=1 Tax=Sphingobacterium sp. UDSM-2020 TaxID=2795738 RepID=UPI001936113F|nr:hypothetical protein [Sphingobacterium sp. UDSM-2020]QQD12117.1 hypothetical protein JAZ75_16000 [Sphingobacterium sp. UDSM-2020]
MKEKFLIALTAQYKDLGFGANSIVKVAHYLAKKVLYEEDIDGVFQDVEGLLNTF